MEPYQIEGLTYVCTLTVIYIGLFLRKELRAVLGFLFPVETGQLFTKVLGRLWAMVLIATSVMIAIGVRTPDLAPVLFP